MDRRRRARRAEAKDGIRNPHIFPDMLRFLRSGVTQTAFARDVLQQPANLHQAAAPVSATVTPYGCCCPDSGVHSTRMVKFERTAKCWWTSSPLSKLRVISRVDILDKIQDKTRNTDQCGHRSSRCLNHD